MHERRVHQIVENVLKEKYIVTNMPPAKDTPLTTDELSQMSELKRFKYETPFGM
jgi:hypothetical protein